MSAGDVLRSSREKKKLSIDDASAATRISKKYIQAMEDGNFSLIPSQVFAKGFLKTYSDYLGLDTKGLLAELSDFYKARETSKRIDIKISKIKKAALLKNAANTAYIVIALLLLIFIFYEYRMNAIKSVKPVEVAPAVQEKIEKLKPVVKSAVKPVATASSTIEAGKVEVRLEIVGKSWVTVTSGVKQLYNAKLYEGAKLKFIGREIKVKAANGGGVKVYINGSPIGLMGEEGVPAEKTYKASE